MDQAEACTPTRGDSGSGMEILNFGFQSFFCLSSGSVEKAMDACSPVRRLRAEAAAWRFFLFFRCLGPLFCDDGTGAGRLSHGFKEPGGLPMRPHDVNSAYEGGRCIAVPPVRSFSCILEWQSRTPAL